MKTVYLNTLVFYLNTNRERERRIKTMSNIQLICLGILTTCVVIFILGTVVFLLHTILTVFLSGELILAGILSLLFIGGAAAMVFNITLDL